MLDNTALCKEKITQEHLKAKHIHSKRIRPRKMQFISEEKYRTETGFTHISFLLYFGMFMPNMRTHTHTHSFLVQLLLLHAI